VKSGIFYGQKKRIKRKIDIFAGRKKIFRPVINSVYLTVNFKYKGKLTRKH